MRYTTGAFARPKILFFTMVCGLVVRAPFSRRKDYVSLGDVPLALDSALMCLYGDDMKRQGDATLLYYLLCVDSRVSTTPRGIAFVYAIVGT